MTSAPSFGVSSTTPSNRRPTSDRMSAAAEWLVRHVQEFERVRQHPRDQHIRRTHVEFAPSFDVSDHVEGRALPGDFCLLLERHVEIDRGDGVVLRDEGDDGFAIGKGQRAPASFERGSAQPAALLLRPTGGFAPTVSSKACRRVANRARACTSFGLGLGSSIEACICSRNQASYAADSCARFLRSEAAMLRQSGAPFAWIPGSNSAAPAWRPASGWCGHDR
ncbi:hypothetical protein BH11PSE8_BH11PSE8_21860 [soil metagenome]